MHVFHLSRPCITKTGLPTPRIIRVVNVLYTLLVLLTLKIVVQSLMISVMLPYVYMLLSFIPCVILPIYLVLLVSMLLSSVYSSFFSHSDRPHFTYPTHLVFFLQWSCQCKFVWWIDSWDGTVEKIAILVRIYLYFICNRVPRGHLSCFAYPSCTW